MDHSQINRGVRGLTYSYEFGGNIASYGFENHINLWCPEISLTRAFIGRLQGHTSIVEQCKFLEGTPNLISIDNQSNVRIWDIRTQNCTQVIMGQKKSNSITAFAISPINDNFITGDIRLQYFENVISDKSPKNDIDDMLPIYVEFNQCYNTLFILTKIDMRIYDAITGRLMNVFNEVHDEKQQIDLTRFCFGSSERKFYLSDNTGMIRVYNTENGEYMKKVNLSTDVNTDDLNYKGNNYKKKDNNHISQMIYINSDKILITVGWDSLIRMYDESESEESQLVRVILGGHNELEILCIAFSEHQQILASGSINGQINVWQYETGRLDAILKGHQGEVTSLQFGDPLPILLSAGSDGYVCVWGMKQTENHYRFQCIVRVLNQINIKDNYFNVGITSMLIQNEIIDQGLPFSNLKDDSKLKDIFPQEYLDYKSIKKQEKHSIKKKDGLTSQRYKNEDKSKFIQQKQKYVTELNEKKRRFYVFISDSKGFMSILNLTEMLEDRGIQECEAQKPAIIYQLKRKQIIDATKQVENTLNHFELTKKTNKLPFSIIMEKTVQINRWQAHNQSIHNLSFMKIPDNPLIICSSSLDRSVKFWTVRGERNGEISSCPHNKREWSLPINWVDRKTQELSNVFEIIELLDQVKLSQQEKDDITMDFLIRKYLSDDDKLQKYMNEYQEQNKDKLEIQVQQQIRIKKSQNQMSRFDNLDHLNLQDVQKKIREEQNQKQNERIIVEKIKFLQAQKDQKDHEDEIFQKKMQRRDQNGLSFKLQSKINELDKKKNTIYNQNESFELKASHVRMPSGGLLSSTQNHNFNQLKSKKTSLIEDSHKLIRTNEKIQKNFSFIDNLNTIQSNLKPQFSMTDQFKQQNKKFVKNLVKSYSINSFKPNNLVMDVKYKPGESIRTMKIIQSGQEMRFQALSQNIYGASNEILQKNMKIHKDLKGAKQIQNQLIIQEKRRKSQMNNINQEVNQLDISGDDSDRQINLQNKKAKIITNKRFMSNPKKNLQMTLIKSNNNYYVLDL